jgi:hypothetical protein
MMAILTSALRLPLVAFLVVELKRCCLEIYGEHAERLIRGHRDFHDGLFLFFLFSLISPWFWWLFFSLLLLLLLLVVDCMFDRRRDAGATCPCVAATPTATRQQIFVLIFHFKERARQEKESKGQRKKKRRCVYTTFLNPALNSTQHTELPHHQFSSLFS